MAPQNCPENTPSLVSHTGIALMEMWQCRICSRHFLSDCSNTGINVKPVSVAEFYTLRD